MPERPAGEAGLEQLTYEFMRAEGYVLALLGEAAVGRDPLPPFHPLCSCVATG